LRSRFSVDELHAIRQYRRKRAQRCSECRNQQRVSHERIVLHLDAIACRTQPGGKTIGVAGIDRGIALAGGEEHRRLIAAHEVDRLTRRP
jgi:hypothetical protein